MALQDVTENLDLFKMSFILYENFGIVPQLESKKKLRKFEDNFIIIWVIQAIQAKLEFCKVKILEVELVESCVEVEEKNRYVVSPNSLHSLIGLTGENKNLYKLLRNLKIWGKYKFEEGVVTWMWKLKCLKGVVINETRLNTVVYDTPIPIPKFNPGFGSRYRYRISVGHYFRSDKSSKTWKIIKIGKF